MNYLQPYKGKSTRHTCPACQTKHSFTLYLNGNIHEPIHRTVGKCNREIKCGYHYTPKQYFADNCTDAMLGVTKSRKPHAPSPLERAGVRFGEVPIPYLINSLSPKSNFVSFLQNHFFEDQINNIFEKYLLGATKNKEVIFWQIDIKGKVRTGKIMQYNHDTGKRIKYQSGAINWVHYKLKKSGALPEDFNLHQCFFGEHLLATQPTATVAIVESEKTACIASCIIPELIWLAAGSQNGLSIEKCQVLKNRNVILFPDQGAFEKWKLKTHILKEQSNCKITVSSFLENEIIETGLANGFDVADYIIDEIQMLT